MGNWIRVKIEGTCDASEVTKLRSLLTMADNYENFHCLMHTGGICGLPNWASENINAVGNLAERDYDADAVAETLEELCESCPTLDVKIHVGADNEGDDCVATVYVNDEGVHVGDAEVEKIPPLDDAQMHSNMFSALLRR